METKGSFRRGKKLYASAPSKYAITPITAAVTDSALPGLCGPRPGPGRRPGRRPRRDHRNVTKTLRVGPGNSRPPSRRSRRNRWRPWAPRRWKTYSRFVPSVNVVTYGGSGSTVVFRGAITGPDYIGQATSSVYLDEISVTQTGSQPTIRAVDIAARRGADPGRRAHSMAPTPRPARCGSSRTNRR